MVTQNEDEKIMTNLVQKIDNEYLKDKSIPHFNPGDTVVVSVKIKEGSRERVQAYEGVVIAMRNRGINSAFTVRKISYGTGVERVFQTYSPSIAKITVKRRGRVRRSKLYYLAGLTGKNAKIKERIGYEKKLAQRAKLAEASQSQPPSQPPAAASLPQDGEA